MLAGYFSYYTTKPSACNDSIPLRAIFLPPGPLRKKPFFGMMKKWTARGQNRRAAEVPPAAAQANPAAAIRYPPRRAPVLIPSQNKGASCQMIIKIGTVSIPKTAALAPLAGVADRAFREVCRALGAAYTVGEMTSSKGLTYQNKKPPIC